MDEGLLLASQLPTSLILCFIIPSLFFSSLIHSLPLYITACKSLLLHSNSCPLRMVLHAFRMQPMSNEWLVQGSRLLATSGSSVPREL